jgi:predicted NAD-dependent protein-ADP-ribosyltransferase YbiA (DUF1768 family)
MTNIIRLYSPNEKPFGILSNNSYHPITIDGKKYSTVTNYIFSNMLLNPSNRTLLQNAEITGSSGANQELLRAIDYLINSHNSDKEIVEPVYNVSKSKRERHRRILFMTRFSGKNISYYEKMSDSRINKKYARLKEKQKEKEKNISPDEREELKKKQKAENELNIEKSFGYLAEGSKEDRLNINKQEVYKRLISRETRAPFDSINLEKLKQQIINEGELNKMGIYKLMDKVIYQELYETIFKAINEGFTERILGEVNVRSESDVKKVIRYPEIIQTLLSTENKPIQYQSSDIFLGTGTDGKGGNIVGKVLMQIRHGIRIKKVFEQRSKQDEEKKKDIYNTYLAYMILNEEMDNNKNNLVEYIGLTPEQIVNKYGLSNFTKGIPSQETIMQMYSRCNLNDIIMKEIFQPGTLVINVRKFGLRNLQYSLKQYKKDIIFNSYLEYMIIRKFEDEVDKETDRIYDIKEDLYKKHTAPNKWKIKNTKPDRNNIKNDIIQNTISQQTSKLSSDEFEKLKERVVDLFNLGMLSASLSDRIDSDILKLEIPTDQEVEQAEIAEIPAPPPNSQKNECEQESSGGSSDGSIEESDTIAKYLKSVLGSEKQSKKEMIKTLIKIQGGIKEDYNDMRRNDLRKMIKSISSKKQEEKYKQLPTFVKPEGSPIVIFTDDNNNQPEIRPFNPIFYTGMFTIEGRHYPTIQHYMIAKLIASSGTKRISIEYGVTYMKGMGIDAAHQLILVNHTFNGSEPGHYKNLQLCSSIYDDEERNANKLLTSLLTVTGLNKKFEDRDLQNILITTGDSIIEWASPYTKYTNLIAGTDEIKGENYVGITMMDIREKIKESRKDVEEIFVQPEDITKFVQSDSLVKEWITMQVKDMCGTTNRLQQYLKLKDNFDYDLQHDTELINLINFSLDKIYKPCNSLISLSKENISVVPSFVIDIVSKCSGMDTGEPPVKIMNTSGQLIYNKQIQEKINENTRNINNLETEFWGGSRLEYSREESKEFEEKQRNDFHQFWDEINSSDMSTEEKETEREIFKKGQKDEYNEFWGIQTGKKTKDDISRHEHAVKELGKELSEFLREVKNREKHYFLIIKEIAQLYWDRLSAMLSVIIQNLPRSSTGSNIRDILIKAERINSETSNCIHIISNEENNCIVSAILNLMTGILLFKEEFSRIQELDTDDVKLSGSIILNTQFQPDNVVPTYEDEDEDEKSQFDVGETGLFPEDEQGEDGEQDEDDEDNEGGDYADDGSDNLEENPYFGFKWSASNSSTITRKVIGYKGGKQLNNKDIASIETKLMLMSKNTKNYKEIAIEIMKMVNTIKNSNVSQKIKQNRINFFATIR